MMKPLTQYALALLIADAIALLIALAWGVWRGWDWADYATAAVTIRVLLVVIGHLQTEKAGGAATVGAVGAPNRSHHTILTSGKRRAGSVDG